MLVSPSSATTEISVLTIFCFTRVIDYKNKGGFKQDDLRRRREEQQVEIRRQKREENIAKRRNFQPTSSYDSDEEAGTSNWEQPVNYSILSGFPVADMHAIFAGC